LIVIFQPHRYTRTKALYDRFVTSFNQVDMLVVVPIYPAGEKPIEGVDSSWLQQGIKERGHKDVSLGNSHGEILELLLKVVKPGDRVITLGAGDVYRIGEELLEKM
jgi:UDP-N-acetylmuramate--alanine ligase